MQVKNAHKITDAIERMVYEMPLQSVIDFVVEAEVEHYLSEDISQEEITDLLNEYGE